MSRLPATKMPNVRTLRAVISVAAGTDSMAMGSLAFKASVQTRIVP